MSRKGKYSVAALITSKLFHCPLLPIIALGVIVIIIISIIIGITAGSSSAADDDGRTESEISSNVTVAYVANSPTVNPTIYTDRSEKFSKDFSFTNGILIDIDKGEVLASREAEEKIYPASLTKIMTLIVAIENCADLSDTFTMTSDIIDPLIMESASLAGFAPGEEVSVKDMLYGLILPSGADAALGLAEHVAGSEEAFAELMNIKAVELGLTETHFVNVSGLHDDDHYSTCHDMALILSYAIKDSRMKDILSTYKYTTASTAQHPEGIELISTLFSRMYGNEPECAFVVGGKTGYTLEAHHCLASFAVRCSESESEASIYAKIPSLVLVTVGDTDMWGPIFDAIDIYSRYSEK